MGKTMASKNYRLEMLVVILVFGAVLTGCATQIGQFTMATTKNVDLSRLGQFNRTSREVKAQDSTVYILGFKVKTAKMNAALDKALARIPGAVALIDVRISTKSTSLILVRFDSYIVSGTALVDPQIVSGGSSNENPQLVAFSEEGEIIEVVAITQEEYDTYLNNSVYILQ
jgi:hypothetical protein